jgi:heme exporter protein D
MVETPHLGFIVAAYAGTALITAGLILWILLDHRAQRRALAGFEAEGAVRGSDGHRPTRAP